VLQNCWLSDEPVAIQIAPATPLRRAPVVPENRSEFFRLRRDLLADDSTASMFLALHLGDYNLDDLAQDVMT
jgi:hypothetical protein